jgi:hypothetical protein
MFQNKKIISGLIMLSVCVGCNKSPYTTAPSLVKVRTCLQMAILAAQLIGQAR